MMMYKQLIITGFHRSGTSMLTQELHNAGLFVGDRLLGPHVSNADGHYEDCDFFNFHEKILRSFNETWQYTSKETLAIEKKCEVEMERIIYKRSNEHKEWGFKDPRTSLFLSQWQEKLDNPYTVVMYRHYEECVNSLLHRASRQVGDNICSDISFWEDPALAYKMWITYNQHIIRHIKKYPDTSIVVSHSAMIDGFPIVKTLNEKFGFTLDPSIESAVKKELLSPQNFPSYSLDEQLKKELDETWAALQSLSIVPSNTSKSSPNTKAPYSMNEFQDILKKLEVKTEERNVIQNIIDKLDDATVEIKEKVSIIKKNRSLFTQFNVNGILINALIRLLKKEYSTVELYFIISELYRVEKNYELAEFYILKVFTVTDKVFPYFYNNLSLFYLNTNQLLLAEDAIKKALQGNPNNPSFYVTLSILEEKKCHNELAIEHMDKAIAMFGENINAEIKFKLRKINILYLSMEEEKTKLLIYELLEKYPDDALVKKRAKDILEVKNTILDKKKEEEQVLVRLREDENYFSKIVSLVNSLDNDWAKSNLLSRVVEYLARLEISKKNTLSNLQYLVSFVVDALPLHYYQAELLLYSLEQFARVKKEHILVQCLNRVDKVFLDYLDKEGYAYRIIEPYLDGKYCNKLQQLEAFKDKDLKKFDGVILLDTDMFALAPLYIPSSHKFSAKTVDAPNPPIEVLKTIFKEAKIDIPEIVYSDWDMPNNQTFACNFNGGFYYVPVTMVSKLSTEWRKWASWLYERSDLFANKQQSIHTDQVSMAMAITSLQIPYHNLSANGNTPTHNDKNLSSFKEDMDVILLHYHREISSFGLLNKHHVSNQKIIEAIDTANSAIAQKEKYNFFLAYKKSLVSKVDSKSILKDMDKVLEELTRDYSRKLTLIFHAGTPKTATTSLQFFLDEHSDFLKENGILYPKQYMNTPAPKHQWLVGGLIHHQENMLIKRIQDSLAEVDANTHTIIFSTEGLYNHWQDFDLGSKSFFTTLRNYFNVKLWICFREPVSFLDSLYRQYLKNPQMNGIMCYGKDLSIDEMMEDLWFITHLDYVGFLLECDEVFEEENVEVFKLENDIIKQVCLRLGLSIDIEDVKRKNISLNTASIEILRKINQYPLLLEEKEKVVDLIYNIDTFLDKYVSEELLSLETKEKIQKLFSSQESVLRKKYNLAWDRELEKSKKGV